MRPLAAMICAFWVGLLGAVSGCTSTALPVPFGVTMLEETICIGQGGQIMTGPDGAFCAKAQRDVMIRVVAGLMVAILVGCAQEQPILPQVDIFRDLSAQIASQTNVSADRMAGRWFIRQGFTNQSGPVGAVTFSTLPNGALQMAQTRLTCEVDTCLNVESLVLLSTNGIKATGFQPVRFSVMYYNLPSHF